MNKVDTFFIPIEVQKNPSMRVTYNWEVKISRVVNTYYGAACCDNFGSKSLKWTNLNVNDETTALEKLESFCWRNSK